LPFEEGSMSVEFTNCTFSDLSNLELGAIANVGGMSVIVDSVFQGITSEESSITVSENGTISLSTSCFGGNSGDLPGTVFVDDSSTLDVNDDNFGSENVGGNGTCNDIFDEGSGLCVPFEADSCLLPAFTFTATPSVAPSQVPSAFNTTASPTSSVAPSQVPSVLNVTLSPVPSSVPSAMPSVSCFSEYDLLAEAVTEAGSNGTGGVFTICPDTVFNLFVPPNSDVLPIVINASDTIIQCGPDGSKTNECILLGGSRHFEIAGSVTGVELKGLTFIGATDVSVGAFGSSNASATFDDCE